jgi:hypothetical protein
MDGALAQTPDAPSKAQAKEGTGMNADKKGKKGD